MTEAETWQRQRALACSGGVCEICGKTLTQSTWQGAHRIANTQANRKKWGDWIIDHWRNIAIVCSLNCNQVCNIGYDEGACLNLIQEILDEEKKRFKGDK